MTDTQLAILREACEGDEGRLADLLDGLSSESRFQRFLVGLGAAKPSLVRALLATGHDRGAWLAVGADGRAVGHACWVISPAGVVDVGVVVADAAQGHGIGRALFTAAVGRAAERGAYAVHLDVHPENRKVAGILRRRFGREAMRFTEGMVIVDAPIAALLVPAPGRTPTAAGPPAEQRPAAPAA